MKGKVLLFCVLFCIANSMAQNLVLNPGFEDYFECPTEINTTPNTKLIAPHWFSPSAGTPDLFNHCSKNTVTGVSNFAGVVNALEGKGYAGIISWKKDGFSEYLSTKLSSPLIKDTQYIVSFQYRLSRYSMYASDRMGLLISADSIFVNHDKVLNLETAYIRKRAQALDEETGTWQKMEYAFLAQGGEQYLTIGNFSPAAQTKVKHMYWKHVQNPVLENAAYYYIDEVSVIPSITDSLKIEKEKNEFSEAQFTPIPLTELKFDHDKSVIKPSSYAQLDRLVSYLEKNQDKITITGHTDQSGNELYNLKLSEKRANAVANYLVYRGIKTSRIKVKGVGSKSPLSSTDLDKNRRVEIILGK